MELSPTFYYVIIGYFIVIVTIGLLAGRGNKTSEDHLVAGRSIGPVIGGAALAATQLSAGTFVGTIGVLYLTGASYLWYWPGLLLGWVVSAIWVAPKLQKFKGVTIPEYIGVRYNSNAARIISAVLIIIAYTVYLIAQYVAGGILIHTIFGLPMVWGATITIGITLVYTLKGGMKATAYSDFLQAIIMAGCFFVSIPILYSQAGGLESVGQFVTELNPQLTGWYWSFKDLLGFALAFGLSIGIAPYELARMYTMKNEKTVRLAIGYSFIFQATIAIAIGLSALGIRAVYPVISNPDAASSIMALDLLPPVIGALFMVAILASIMSTVSGVMIVSSSAVSHDIYGLLKKDATDKQKLFVNKIAVVVLSVFPLIFAVKPFDMVQFIVLVQASMVASFFFGVVVIGLNWKRATTTAAIFSMIGGLLTVLVWYLLGKPFGIDEVIPGVTISMILLIVISLFTKPVPRKALEPFFNLEK